jgi:hypothetical protein
MSAQPALIDARLGVGTLTIAATDYSYQIANVALEPDISDEDGTPTLAVPDPPPLATIAWNLTGTAIQDFTGGPSSFLNYLMDHALEEVAFAWTPNTEDGTSYTGTVQLRPITIGGDAGVQITSDFTLPVVGEPVRVDGVDVLSAGASRRSSKTE